MTPEQKAKELVDAFSNYTGIFRYDAKFCALIAVEEIIKEIEQLRKPEYTTFIISYEEQITMDGYQKLSYWQQVKTEIEKL